MFFTFWITQLYFLAPPLALRRRQPPNGSAGTA